MGDRQCSFSLTTFNPTGKLVQVEHALTAVESGQTSPGIKASAMGKNVSNAKTFLEKRYTDDMELDVAVHTAILTLKEGFEGQIYGENIETGQIYGQSTISLDV